MSCSSNIIASWRQQIVVVGWSALLFRIGTCSLFCTLHNSTLEERSGLDSPSRLRSYVINPDDEKLMQRLNHFQVFTNFADTKVVWDRAGYVWSVVHLASGKSTRQIGMYNFRDSLQWFQQPKQFWFSSRVFLSDGTCVYIHSFADTVTGWRRCVGWCCLYRSFSTKECYFQRLFCGNNDLTFSIVYVRIHTHTYAHTHKIVSCVVIGTKVWVDH